MVEPQQIMLWFQRKYLEKMPIYFVVVFFTVMMNLKPNDRAF